MLLEWLKWKSWNTSSLWEKVVIGDALHTQKGLSRQIVAAESDYLWFVKGDQTQVEEVVRLWFESDVQLLPGMNFPSRGFESAILTN